MSKYIAPCSVITVADIELTGYKTEDNQWVMSLSSLARVLNLTHKAPGRFLGSKWLEQRLGKGKDPDVFSLYTEDSTKPIVAIDTSLVFLYFLYHDFKYGNPVASKLVTELGTSSLDIRFEGNLTPDLPYAEVEQRALNIQEVRQVSKKYHNGFIHWYKRCGYSGKACHDYLTIKLIGMTAEQARQTWSTCAGDEDSIGLDHWQPEHMKQLDILAKVKDILTYQHFRPSTEGSDYKAAINRAYTKAIQE